jgi:hypothetical protein
MIDCAVCGGLWSLASELFGEPLCFGCAEWTYGIVFDWIGL